jgi:hypothetical protein
MVYLIGLVITLGVLAFAVMNIWDLVERIQQKRQQRKLDPRSTPPRSWRFW